MSNNKKKNKKSILFIVVFVLILFLIALIIMYLYNNVFTIKKIDSSNDYVYTFKKVDNVGRDDDSYDEIPKVNIISEDATKVNKEILDVYNSLNTHTEYGYQYEFSKSNNILSLKIVYSYYLSNSSSEITKFFNTYNFNLKTGKLMSDSELLSMYGITSKQLNSQLEKRFKSYYKDLVNLDYYTKDTCNYDCFLKNRGITSKYTDDVYLYVDNGSLVLFKFFYKTSVYEEEYYFIDDTYKFIIKRK